MGLEFEDIFRSTKGPPKEPTLIETPETVFWVSIGLRTTDRFTCDRDLYESIVKSLKNREVHIQLGGIPEQLVQRFRVSFPVYGLKIDAHPHKPGKFDLKDSEIEKAIKQVTDVVIERQELFGIDSVMAEIDAQAFEPNSERPPQGSGRWGL
ncbi:unnamed protein product [Penicillium bialowiezense]